MDFIQMLQLAATAVGGILIPLVIFIIGRRFAKQRERADARHQHLLQIGQLIESLSSDNRKKRLIALQIVDHLRRQKELPPELLETISGLAVVDDPLVAGAARVVLGLGQEIPDSVVLIELLAPMIAHLDRTKDAFNRWNGFNEALEDDVMRSNKFIRDHLISRWHLIPPEYSSHAQELITHYEAWLAKYKRLRPEGVRDPSEPFVFVGPDGFPFPKEAAKKFRKWYERLLVNHQNKESTSS